MTLALTLVVLAVVAGVVALLGRRAVAASVERARLEALERARAEAWAASPLGRFAASGQEIADALRAGFVEIGKAAAEATAAIRSMVEAWAELQRREDA